MAALSTQYEKRNSRTSKAEGFSKLRAENQIQRNASQR
jgi:hypothetical protein